MKKGFTILIAASLVLSFASSCKKNCTTQRCGRVIITDRTIGGGTAYTSDEVCGSDDEIEDAIVTRKALFPGSDYTARFDETGTREVCSD